MLPLALLDASGSTVASYTYDPYGKILSAEGTMVETNPLRYRGYYYDTESGLYYLQSRYYDPAVCRFVNTDNAAVISVSPEKANWDKNLFAYCDNDPVNRKDDGGELWASALIGGIVGGIIGGVSSAVNDYIMGRPVTLASVAKGAVSGFLTGAISNMLPTKKIFTAVSTIGSGISAFVTAKTSGASVRESLLSAMTAATSTYLSSKLGKSMTGKGAEAAKGIVSFFTSGGIEGLASAGRGIYRSAQNSHRQTYTTPANNYSRYRSMPKRMLT